MTKILAFSGSSSSKSINQQLVKMAVARFRNTDVTLIDIRDYPLPIYSIDIEESAGFPENAQRLRELLSEHDGFLLASPENNGSMPAILKNLIDWMSRMGGKIFQDKPVALLSASPGGGGGATNLANMETLMPWWGGEVVGKLSVGGYHELVGQDALSLSDPQFDAELSKLVTSLEQRLQPAAARAAAG